MKKCVVLLVSLFALLHAQSQITKGTYGVKSGYVEYQLTGNTTGIKKLWWDDFGAKSRTETQSLTTISMFGITNETKIHSISVINNNNYYFSNLLDKTGQEGKISDFGLYQEVDELSEKEKEEMAEEIFDEMGGEKLGSEDFLGYQCEVIALLGSKSWVWEGVILKTEVETMGVVANEIAVKFDKNIPVSSHLFETEVDIEYQKPYDY